MRSQRSVMKWVVLTAICLLLGLGAIAPPVQAAIRETEEAPGQVVYQSRHRLGDRSGNSWQLVLFQRVKAGVPESASLRIVGFPGRDTFLHPQPLQVRSRQTEFLAPDMFAAQAPAANVGQYDMQEILPQLSTNNSMELTLPLASDRPVHLRVPDVVVLEWKLMVKG